MHKLDVVLLSCVTSAIAQVLQYAPVPPAPAGVPSDYVQVSRQPDAVNPGASNVPSFNCADLADGFYSLGPCSRYFASCAGNTTNYMECPQGLVLVKSTETQCDYAPSDCEASTPDLTSQTQTSETVSETTQYGSNATSFYGANSSVTPTVPKMNSGESNSSSTIQSQAYTLTSEHPTSSTTDDLATSTTYEPASSTTEYPTSSTTEEPLPSGAQALIQDYFRQRILNPRCNQEYWYCVNRIAFKRHCPYGYRFNQLAQKCDEEDKVPQCAKQ
ncbi:chitin binding peritrophin-A domain-containing protein [Ditylenchus destructor]|uniref:Chitin binding peritrophin-A domain-containing protein n=1 Tax=Ditylenchus destructor TaxID=166010 RepID=A0AAD4MPX6_9BILA|nr:chitin binding peritrophin-A domain-containing protein [Ditylenchus destructor]